MASKFSAPSCARWRSGCCRADSGVGRLSVIGQHRWEPANEFPQFPQAMHQSGPKIWSPPQTCKGVSAVSASDTPIKAGNETPATAGGPRGVSAVSAVSASDTPITARLTSRRSGRPPALSGSPALVAFSIARFLPTAGRPPDMAMLDVVPQPIVSHIGQKVK
jgi:hypothetical protein